METTTTPRKFFDLSSLPKEYEHQKMESLWKEMWDKIGIYSFKNDKPRDQTFVIDTPPPTVSGTLHIGHLFSYTHTDLIARFQRMQGKDIFYPMGFDDNGLPTERRVQNYFNVTCDATLPYDHSFKREKQEDQPIQAISRQNFIELCNQLTQEDEKAFIDLWKRLGLSVDWKLQYATIDSHSRRTAQISFLDLINRDKIYANEYPVMWDIDFKTSVAQAECEDREISATMHEIQFNIFSEENSEKLETFIIGTTRPELLPACIAIVINPDDERHKHLKGKQALTPLFHTKVPILTSPLVSLEKGTGVVMVCTFGDQTDILWWQEFKLPLRQIIGKDGKLSPIQFTNSGLFTSCNPETANRNYEKIQGCIIPKARKIIVDQLKQEGLLKSTSSFMHQVKFFEKGNSPLEFLSTRQWYVRIMDKKKEMMEMGAKLTWYPDFMIKKFNDWTEHLKFDWCISRQRYFGVPFPLWYPLDSIGNPEFSKPIYPTIDMLPIDPTIHTPPGFKSEQRNQPNGFTSEDCVFDTWFTSSLTPQIMSGWHKNKELHEKIFPMDLRPQSHEIIRTWTFYTVAKALFHENKLPWTTVAISGWVLDPDRKKMSKSKGNVMTPLPIIQEFSADGARYWAALAKLGSDTAFDKSVFQNGKRLVLKLFNAGKFIFSQTTSDDLEITQDLDLSFLSQLKSVVKQATDAFKNNEYSVALTTTEFFFYHGLTDNYIELIRDRLKNGTSIEKSSAVNTLRFSISILLRLFAPFLPYITEEIWSWILREETKIQSIHIASWPSEREFDRIQERKGDLFATAVTFLEEIRKIKGKEKMRALQHFASLEMAVPEKLHEEAKNVMELVMKAMLVDKWNLAKTEGEIKILAYQPKV